MAQVNSNDMTSRELPHVPNSLSPPFAHSNVSNKIATITGQLFKSQPPVNQAPSKKVVQVRKETARVAPPLSGSVMAPSNAARPLKPQISFDESLSSIVASTTSLQAIDKFFEGDFSLAQQEAIVKAFNSSTNAVIRAILVEAKKEQRVYDEAPFAQIQRMTTYARNDQFLGEKTYVTKQDLEQLRGRRLSREQAGALLEKMELSSDPNDTRHYNPYVKKCYNQCMFLYSNMQTAEHGLLTSTENLMQLAIMLVHVADQSERVSAVAERYIPQAVAGQDLLITGQNVYIAGGEKFEITGNYKAFRPGVGGALPISKQKQLEPVAFIKSHVGTDVDSVLAEYRLRKEVLKATTENGLAPLHFVTVINRGTPISQVVAVEPLMQELFTVLQKVQLSPDDQINIVGGILTGLNTLHEKEYVHLDVKPENILIRKDNKGKYYSSITDFGFVRPKSEPWLLDTYGTIECTDPGFPANRASYKNDYSKLDIFAVGEVLYELSHGGRTSPWVKHNQPPTEPAVELLPEALNSYREQIQKQLSTHEAALDTKEEFIQRLLYHVTDPDPDNRPTAAELLHNYQLFMQLQAISS